MLALTIKTSEKPIRIDIPQKQIVLLHNTSSGYNNNAALSVAQRILRAHKKSEIGGVKGTPQRRYRQVLDEATLRLSLGPETGTATLNLKVIPRGISVIGVRR